MESCSMILIISPSNIATIVSMISSKPCVSSHPFWTIKASFVNPTTFSILFAIEQPNKQKCSMIFKLYLSSQKVVLDNFLFLHNAKHHRFYVTITMQLKYIYGICLTYICDVLSMDLLVIVNNFGRWCIVFAFL